MDNQTTVVKWGLGLCGYFGVKLCWSNYQTGNNRKKKTVCLVSAHVCLVSFGSRDNFNFLFNNFSSDIFKPQKTNKKTQCTNPVRREIFDTIV